MKTQRTMMGWVWVLLLGLMLSFSAQASSPRSINFQGYLTDSVGAPLNGSQSVVFCLYATEISVASLWCDTKTVTLSQGLFEVTLDESTTPFPPGLFGIPLYLGLNVNGDGEMVPRIALTSEAYAFHADDADTVGGESLDSAVTTIYPALVNPAGTGNGNTAYGIDALVANTSGYYDTAIGVSTLTTNTTGWYDTATGHSALTANTTGYRNTANGAFSLQSNTDGNDNTANGTLALGSNTSGSYNTATGTFSLRANTTGHDNTATGYEALFHNTTGFENAATGDSALFSNTTGYGNTANGVSALYYNTTGPWNTAMGYEALHENTGGAWNTALGNEALYSNSTGDSNTALGNGAAYNTTTGSNNTAIGQDALRLNTTGYMNTAVGNRAGYSNTTGFGNVFLGPNAGDSENGNNKLYIANSTGTPLIYGDFDHSWVGIGTTDTHSHPFAVAGAAIASAWDVGSSREYKEKIRYLKADEGRAMLATLLNLAPARYVYKPEYGGDGSPMLGFIAEEVPQEVRAKDGKGVDLYKLITYTIASVQAMSEQKDGEIAVQRADIADEKAKIAEQASEITAEKAEIAALKKEANKVAALEKDKVEQADEIAALQDKTKVIDVLQEKNAELEQAATDQADEIAALKGRIEMLARAMTSNALAQR